MWGLRPYSVRAWVWLNAYVIRGAASNSRESVVGRLVMIVKVMLLLTGGG